MKNNGESGISDRSGIAAAALISHAHQKSERRCGIEMRAERRWRSYGVWRVMKWRKWRSAGVMKDRETSKAESEKYEAGERQNNGAEAKAI
jgi:hypothetical protein